ncbi:site-2 protease family protein [Desulfopila inferna]|uniref:site-2 protease family protein n=1 Tax=Desulfopila inferna TaxID=468528 RepID=UPI001962BDA0|nr:site-2 protease family protein [Desulfopila inferna]MBM9605562.1 site-2 protease family protein [Desulfopila inferna]
MTEILTKIVLLAPPILLALTLHEFAHGYVAYRLGDPTAKTSGRLTLNPISHLDPFGTLAFFLINIGWAKPVPVNGAYFRNPRKDMLWVALAGPVTNLILAIASALVAKFLYQMLYILPDSGIIPAIIAPLFEMIKASIWINLVLCIFNFLPIPPLDGSRILMGLLPDKMAETFSSFERYGFVLILILAFTGILSKMIFPVIQFAGNLLLS